MKLKIYQIDAFTNTIFKGNSAAVIIIDEWLSKNKMQSIAIENNLSETAFAKKCDDTTYEIRWFSPITEIDFCGHATLAVGTQRIWPARAFTLGHLTHNDLASVRI